MPNRECSRNDCRNDAFDSNARYGNECQKYLCVTLVKSNRTKVSVIKNCHIVCLITKVYLFDNFSIGIVVNKNCFIFPVNSYVFRNH